MEELKCKCGGKIRKALTLFDSFIVGCIKCDKCGEVGFTPEQTRKIIRLRDANKNIQSKRRIIKVGTSIASLLPKQLEKYGIREGMISDIDLLSSKAIKIGFKKSLI